MTPSYNDTCVYRYMYIYIYVYIYIDTYMDGVNDNNGFGKTINDDLSSVLESGYLMCGRPIHI